MTTTPAKITCAQCHADAQAAYQHSFHATAKKPDGSPAATCVDCHGDAHTILPASDPKSPVNHSNIPATCGTCHGQKFLMQSTGGSSQVFVAYQDSVHGHAVENGSQTAAVCTDCHGSHEILARQRRQVADQQVQRSRHLRQVPRRCAERLHAEHSRAGHRARQLAGAGLHRLPRHPHHQGAHRSQLLGLRPEPVERHLRRAATRACG